MTEKDSMQSDHEIDLSIYAQRVLLHLRMISLIAGLGAVAMVIYTLLAQPIFRASASILLVQPATPAPSAAAQAAMALTGASSGSANQAGMLQGILRSETALSKISKKAGIKRLNLEKELTVDYDAKQSIINLSYESKDKSTGLKVVRAALDALETMNREIGFSVAARQATLLEKSVAAAEKELRQSEEDLKTFASSAKTVSDSRPEGASFYFRQLRQSENELGTIETSLSKITSTAVKSSAMNQIPSGVIALKPWQEKLAELQYELQVAQKKYGPEAPAILALESTIAVTKRQLQLATQKYLTSIDQQIEPRLAELEAKRLTADYQVKYWRKLAESVPSEALSISRLGRVVVQKTATLAQLQEQYIRAKIESEVDRVRWTRLDQPFIEAEPVNKSKAKPAILGFLLGGFVGCIFALNRKQLSSPSVNSASGADD